MRQKVGSELDFVTFANGATSTDVNINTNGVSPGNYTLELQSYDTNGGVFSTLKTDTIFITVTDPCPTTTIVLTTPFTDTTYILGDPQKDITWSSDAALGKVAIDPKTCGKFDISFWLFDSALNRVKDVKTLANTFFEVDQINRVFSILRTNSTSNLGTYLIAYKISVPGYPTIPSAISKPFKV